MLQKPEPKRTLNGSVWCSGFFYFAMKDFAESFYKGKAWLACRDSFISRRKQIDGGLCQRCHDELGLIVHHRIELTPENITDPDVALNQELLEYLCLTCHNKEHGVFRPAERSVLFDENGDVVAALDR